MADVNLGQIDLVGRDEELPLQYLGAAVVLCWPDLPQHIRDAILKQSTSIIGLKPTTSLNEQIKAIIRRHNLTSM